MSRSVSSEHATAVLGPSMAAPDGYDWFTFVCTACGAETFVGREFCQSVEDFALMCEWLFGDPPVCSSCLHPDRC